MTLLTRIVTEVGVQDGVGVEDIVAFCLGATVVLTFLGLAHRIFVRPLYREAKDFFAWWKSFQRDWDGEDPAPGRARVPGVMERLNSIDGELQRDGGKSLKDQVIRTRESVEGLCGRMSVTEGHYVELLRSAKESTRT